MNPYLFLVPLFWLYAAWFAYDGWLNPEMSKWRMANRAGAIEFAIPALLITYRAVNRSVPSVSRAEVEPGLESDRPEPDTPSSARRWNWGAFCVAPLWAIGNRVYWGLAAVVPVVGLVIPFVLAYRGGADAWANNAWADEAQFLANQRIWAVWGGAFVVLLILWFLVSGLTAEYHSAA